MKEDYNVNTCNDSTGVEVMISASHKYNPDLILALHILIDTLLLE